MDFGFFGVRTCAASNRVRREVFFAGLDVDFEFSEKKA